MPSGYPDQIDSFSTPATPDTTPLSSAGTSSRNHTESHRDLGDAISQIEQHATTEAHTHNGGTDSHGRPGGTKLDQANTHQNADTDSAPTALHHTLGASATQAAPGNHLHDGRYPQLSQANTFTMKQTFTGGFSVPNGQWASANHTHESSAQGGMSLPWKHIEYRSINATLSSNQDGTWDFTLSALPVVCDLDILCFVLLSSTDAKFQQVDFTMSDITSGVQSIMVGTPSWRRPNATSDWYKQSFEVQGLRLNCPANTVRKIRVGVNNGSAASTTQVRNIILRAEPFNSF